MKRTWLVMWGSQATLVDAENAWAAKRMVRDKVDPNHYGGERFLGPQGIWREQHTRLSEYRARLATDRDRRVFAEANVKVSA